MLVYAICNLFINIGFDITLFVLGSVIEEEHRKCLTGFNKDSKIELLSIDIKFNKGIINDLKNLIFRTPQGTFLPQNQFVKVQDFVAQSEIDMIAAYNIEPIIAMATLDRTIPKIAFMVDLLDHFYARRWDSLKNKPLIQKIKNGISFLSQEQNIDVFYKSLKSIDIIIEHAYHHSLELQEKGFQNVNYLPHPLPINSYSKSYPKDNDKFIVLIVGSFKGVASKLGHEFFFDFVLPNYEILSKRNSENIQFRFVGHGEMETHLKEKVDLSPFCKYIGFVDDIEEEWFKADVVLVTIPIEHGFRTRIAEAMNYSKCVITHTANSKGMPELKHNINCLMSTDGSTIAEYIYNVKNDTGIKIRIGNAAKETFINEISMDSAAPKFKALLKAI